LAEYSGGSWKNVGSWAAATGSYTANGVTSTARNLYILGVTYDKAGRLHIAGTWRENNGGISCSSGGLTNHDTVYVYSDDSGWCHSLSVRENMTLSSISQAGLGRTVPERLWGHPGLHLSASTPKA